MNRKYLLFSLFAIVLTACSGINPTPTAEVNQTLEENQGLGSAVYINTVDLLIAESYPVQVSLQISGELPSPCHEFHYQYEMQFFSEIKRIDVTAFSIEDPAALCTAVLEPFEARIPIPMENAPDGDYAVFLNGDLVSEFSYPGG